MTDVRTIATWRNRAAIARRLSREVLNPDDQAALLEMAEALEASADALEKTEGASGPDAS